jgi:ATP-dependent Clp protease ATP-binding subunit ClpB
LHRRHHARRIPQACRKDAALARRFQPIFVSEPTVEDTISILRGLKGSTSSTTAYASPIRAGGGDHAVEPLHRRPFPARQGDRPDGRGRGAQDAGRFKPEELDSMDREIIRLKIEQEALKKETDASSSRLLTLERLADLEENRPT